MEITLAQSLNLPQLDAQNPWPGLAVYDEASRGFFHGREENAAELLRLIRHAPLTVLFGKSGLGKSSLLQAGLFPKLRSEHFLPVYLHVDFSEKAGFPPFEQVAMRMDAAIKDAGADCPPRTPGEDLWFYLHRKDLEIWSPDNYPLTPVLVFDQLEELFSRSGCSRGLIQSFLDNLADLIENSIPSELADADRVRREQIDIFSQRYRILLAFREDFLAEVEIWKDQVPSLLRNRLRLLPMSRVQAIEAIQQAGTAVLAEGAAERIVEFVIGKKTEKISGHTLTIEGAAEPIGDFIDNSEAGTCDIETIVEPVLLSLCCCQLNRKRRAKTDKIDATLVDTSGVGILEDFYHEAIKSMPENVVKFIEDELIKGDYRNSYPLQTAIDKNFINQDELNNLIGRFRLLRVNKQADTERIELIHDRLVGVVRESREKRQAQAIENEKQLRQEEEEREKQRRQKEQERETLARIDRERREQAEQVSARLSKMNKKLWVCIGAVVAFAILVIILFVFATRQTNLAKKATSQVTAALHEAEEQTKIAKDQRLKAIVLGLVAEAQAMLSGARIESDERAFLQLLAAFCIIPEAMSKTETTLLDVLLKQRDLVKLMMTDDPVLAVAFSPDGSRIASGSGGMTLRLWDVVTGQPVGEPLIGPDNAVSCVAFNHDGSRVIFGSGDKTLRLWDVVTGQPVGEPLIGHKNVVSCVAFSPDGSRIVSGSWDKTLRLWVADTGEPAGELEGLEEPVLSVAFSP
ncbi:MAG: WD40 repeat domain-containing protein, partial [Deltaproteobacteria bacterium]|nr:WD40 repeat domain-containing protein [Deltaproteobacteria bacterium]